MEKIKLELEYALNTSVNILFPRISTSHGLEEWFADEVIASGDNFTFVWDKSAEEAKRIEMKPNKSVKFRWLHNGDDDSYFEFKIQQRELTGDIALIVTDFVDSYDVDDAEGLWNSQINNLCRLMGA